MQLRECPVSTMAEAQVMREMGAKGSSQKKARVCALALVQSALAGYSALLGMPALRRVRTTRHQSKGARTDVGISATIIPREKIIIIA